MKTIDRLEGLEKVSFEYLKSKGLPVNWVSITEELFNYKIRVKLLSGLTLSKDFNPAIDTRLSLVRTLDNIISQYETSKQQ